MAEQQISQRYKIIEKIGEGGIAKVYKAEDTILGRIVAVKVLRDQYSDDPSFLARFKMEARAAASLSHHHIVSVHDLGEENDRHYIVMEYVEGRNLRDAMKAGEPLPLAFALTITLQVCNALQYAHERHIVHRDVKPENIIVVKERDGYSTEKPFIKITDFGIARALGEASFSSPGEIVGTAQYLSPEQAGGTEITGASDIYSLGVLLYEMLTGSLPFHGDSPVSTALKHLKETPKPPHKLNPHIPPALEDIVLTAMAKDPNDRYASATEMSEAISKYLDFGEARTGLFPAPVISPAKSPEAARAPRVEPVKPAAQRPLSQPTQAVATKGGFDWFLMLLALFLIVLLAGLVILGIAVYRTYRPTAAAPSPTSVPAPTSTAELPKVLILVPGIANLDTTQAQALIEGLGLRYQELGHEFSNDFTAGKVIRQEPPSGSSAQPDSIVSVVVSNGPDKQPLPQLVGLKLPDAQARAEALGLVVTPKSDWNKSVEAGTVYAQDPAPGTAMLKGANVTLSVSKGPEVVAMPNVVGLKEDEAKRKITEARLQNYQWVNYQGPKDLPDQLLKAVCVGCVLSSTPPPGTMVEPGTEIKIAVRKD